MLPLAGAMSIAFLGHAENLNDLAGVSFATVVFNYIYGLLNFLRMGTTGVTAQAVGRNDRESIVLIGLRNSLIALGISLLLLALQYPLRELIFSLVNTTAEVKTSAIAYFNVRIWGFPAALLNLIIVGWLLGQEQNKKVLVISVVGNSINVLLNYLFIVKLDWGSVGAGFSQALSDSLMLSIGLIISLQQVPLKEVKEVSKKVLDWSALKASFSLNGNLFIRSLCVMSSYPIFMTISTIIDYKIYLGNALLMQILFLCAFFCDGLGLATETLAGNFKGQEDKEQLKPLLQIAIGTGLLAALFFSGISILFPEIVFGLLTDHSEIIAQTKTYVPWLLSFLVCTSVAFLLDGYFAALAEGHIIRNAALLGITLGFIPLVILAWHFHSNHILWLAMSVFMGIRMLILGISVPKTLKSDYISLKLTSNNSVSELPL